MNDDGRSLDQVTLVQGSIRGYRVWDFSNNGMLESLYHPTVLPPTTKPELPYLAECLSMVGASARIGHRHSHRPVALRCMCGFYAYYRCEIDQLPIQYSGRVVGAVRMSGRVVLGSTGAMRAEKMQLEALMTLRAYPGSELFIWILRRGLRKIYNVPVYSWRQRKKFVRQYPLEGVEVGQWSRS